ncbi:MAG: hypothetical protein RLZZ557_1523 [Bacteroidota bacterium]|jgi:hypothetical protein
MKYPIILSFAIIFFTSCEKQFPAETLVYDNEFKGGKLDNATGATLYNVSGQFYVGRYNRGGFTITLKNLPEHNAIQVEAQPYFHDSWDGSNNIGGIDGPDLWNMSADGTSLVNATFSNSPCNSAYCLFQSYPGDFGIINNPPLTEAYMITGGACFTAIQSITSVYRIVKTFPHSRDGLVLSFRDNLVQTNVPDPLCDESWSMGSLRIKVLNIN